MKEGQLAGGELPIVCMADEAERIQSTRRRMQYIQNSSAAKSGEENKSDLGTVHFAEG